MFDYNKNQKKTGICQSGYILKCNFFDIAPMKDVFPFYNIGHFINQPNNPTEFEITRFGEMEEPEVEDVHKHTFYEILWIESGQSRQTIDYRSYDMACGSLFFISPGQIHEFEAWETVIGGTIMFTEDFFLLNHNDKDTLFELTFLDNVYTNPSLTPNKQSFNDIKQIIDIIWREQNRPNRSVGIIQPLLQTMLSLIQRCVNEQRGYAISKRQLIIFKNFKRLLDQHYVDNWTANSYAEQLNITQHHLNLVVKQVTGKTTSEVVRSRSMLEAKRLLTFTDQSISEIASQLNYFDSSYFTKLFKTETASSPLQFRKLMSEKYQKV